MVCSTPRPLRLDALIPHTLSARTLNPNELKNKLIKSDISEKNFEEILKMGNFNIIHLGGVEHTTHIIH